MQRIKPPFRADMVGSLLRTAPVKQARAQREKGAITAAQLKEVEDREIEKIIKKQEEIGLKLVTDGEFRRAWWHFDFFSMLDGVELYELDHGIQFHGVQTKMQSIKVSGKIGFSNHPMIEHFKFLKAHTKVTPKMCIPAPSQMHFRLEPGAVASLSRGTIDKLGIKPGDMVRVATRRGTIDLAARQDDAIPDGVVFIPFAFVEAAANRLTNPALDPFGKIPEFKYCAARVEAVSASQQAAE